MGLLGSMVAVFPRETERLLSERLLEVARKLKRILVHIPREFLQEFDRETAGLYASRNEAIRAGMIIILESVRNRQGQTLSGVGRKRDRDK